MSSAFFMASDRLIFWCVMSTSVICRPMVNTGLRQVMGSWKIMEMSRPRMACISFSLFSVSSSPQKRMEPPSFSRPPPGSSLVTAKAVMDLPLPDSPTRPRICPGATSRDTSCRMETIPFFTGRERDRCLMESIGSISPHFLDRGSRMSRMPSPIRLNPIMVIRMDRPGKAAYHHWSIA